ncbi:MAG: HAMP domain-containing sensor histidine kinase [Candidatus Izemoplasmatales bacterium]|jgi:signal transduction histidine kinase|nr:HAMP domain-containing sensor histidine kinase [Candidatus Izemoplasmatales bacterium]
MKKWSIKKKIIILYTFFFALLIGMNVYFLKASSSQVLIDQARRDIVSITEEIATELKIEDDQVYLEGNDDEAVFRYFHDSVVFLIYSSTQLAYGPVPTNFDSGLLLEIGKVQTQVNNGTTWLVYDVTMKDGYTLRGIYDINPVSDSINKVILLAAIISPIMILLSALGGYLIIKRSFRPIKEIYLTAASIKDEEDFSKRIPTTFSKDEVYELADMVNQMLDQVEQSMNREKQFSSNVSHELRTPLTVMKAQAEYMLVRAKDNQTKADIKTIMSQISFMENIVSQLLEITRTRQISKSELDLIDLYELIKITGESFTQKLDERNIEFKVIQPDFQTTVLCNQTMMIRVFSNLIVNAIKYNKQYGSITISFNKEGSSLITTFSDTGIGIAKNKLDKVFDPFYRASESRTQEDYSLGLGLALVKEVIQIHNGEIHVQSIENVGTTFTIILPIAK